VKGAWTAKVDRLLAAMRQLVLTPGYPPGISGESRAAVREKRQIFKKARQEYASNIQKNIHPFHGVIKKLIDRSKKYSTAQAIASKKFSSCRKYSHIFNCSG
jgi:hypothetical protein